MLTSHHNNYSLSCHETYKLIVTHTSTANNKGSLRILSLWRMRCSLHDKFIQFDGMEVTLVDG